MAKKGVPVDVVTDQTKVSYVLKSTPIEIKQESTGGKIARCLFAYCVGIEDKGNASVQVIEVAQHPFYDLAVQEFLPMFVRAFTGRAPGRKPPHRLLYQLFGELTGPRQA